MKKIDVIIINGKPRSGKDTVIRMMGRYCDDFECARLLQYSTIDPVKNALVGLGWNMADKDDDTRNLLAAMKQWWISYSNGPLRWCVDKVMSSIYDGDTDDGVIVFQIREPKEIDKLVNVLESIRFAYDMRISTLFVNRLEADGKAYGNSADTDVADYKYGYTIDNNGTIDDLMQAVYGYMDTLFN